MDSPRHDAPAPRPLRPVAWLAVVLALGMSGYLVWTSHAPRVALLHAFGETARGTVVKKDEVRTAGTFRAWDLVIAYEADGEPREVSFRATHYPRAMDTGPFDVAYLPAAPWLAWPAPAMRWSVAMLVIGLVPGMLAVLLAFVAWYERSGRRRPWARRLDAGMESAWQRLSDRMQV